MTAALRTNRLFTTRTTSGTSYVDSWNLPISSHEIHVTGFQFESIEIQYDGLHDMVWEVSMSRHIRSQTPKYNDVVVLVVNSLFVRRAAVMS